MAMGVIDRLEAVEVGHQHCENLSMTAGAAHRLAEPIGKQGTVWQLGEGTALRE